MAVRRRFSLSPDAYRRVTLFALVSLCAIVVTGAAVRLTGSGLGCSDWPTCEQGQLAPAEMSDAPAMIEFVNRTITGLVSVAAAIAVLGSLVRVPRRRDLTLLSWGLVGGVMAQILIGAMVVLLHLSPKTVIAHFLVSMVIVWNAVVLHHRAGIPDDEVRRLLPVHPSAPLMGRALVGAAAVAIFLGTVVTGSGPHTGDHKGKFIDRLPFAVSDVARLHSLAVWLFLALTVASVVQLRRLGGSDEQLRRASVLLAVIVAQGALGYTQYFTGVPPLLVGVHIAGAIAVWVATLRFALALRVPEQAVARVDGGAQPAGVPA